MGERRDCARGMSLEARFLFGEEMEKVFCSECREYVKIKSEMIKFREEFKEREYEYDYELNTCTNCGEEYYTPEAHDKNLKALYAAYRRENDLISL